MSSANILFLVVSHKNYIEWDIILQMDHDNLLID